MGRQGQGCHGGSLDPKGCISAASSFILHIPGGDLPLFLCPFPGVPAATWPSGARQHLVQVSK